MPKNDHTNFGRVRTAVKENAWPENGTFVRVRVGWTRILFPLGCEETFATAMIDITWLINYKTFVVRRDELTEFSLELALKVALINITQ